jgi:hypothetical protein
MPHHSAHAVVSGLGLQGCHTAPVSLLPQLTPTIPQRALRD